MNVYIAWIAASILIVFSVVFSAAVGMSIEENRDRKPVGSFGLLCCIVICLIACAVVGSAK